MTTEFFESRVYEVEILTPTVIGGQDKIQSFEFVRDGAYLYFINFDRLLEENLFKESFVDELTRGLSGNLKDFNIHDVMTKYNMDFRQFSKYKLKLEGVQKFPREIVAFVKSAGRFYIPGSSLKGGIRSFVTKALKKDLIKHYEDALNPKGRVNPQHLSSDADKKVFSSPDQSPFKYLQISDSSFADPDDVAVFEIKVMNICSGQVKWFAGVKEGKTNNVDNPEQSSSILAEGIKPGVKVFGSMKVEKDFVDGNEVVSGLKGKIGINVSAASPEEFLAEVMRAVARDYIKREIDFYSKYNQAQIVSEYRKLLDILNSLEPNQFLIQIGFSTGYLSKTVGIFFTKTHFEKLKMIDKKSNIYPDLFPKTRRIIFKNGQVYTVPGWIKVTIR
ncbi:CRISPR-associated RAMP protein, Csm5 family [Caldicellulosiruptor saccharolyticus DSM 8903]|uniref:CRISPR system Cms protein Csm5 n=1 Tax=Caldicellulosiruptor saccharolyticus (strain ATCC 43494 / DSM 8903 / Tp8T 6331) TaxID=351627 RepID=A4XFP8_CALS8|nr:type III-A CRISPR-associated RAMP protein Csm5 [Caldicellulosiruptor saccharolyticus]ABP65733.1 CRISPR-associated RAMP protein, Csm5 family [Caldicellulosiruptor saccharolyticus DSM 8903]